MNNRNRLLIYIGCMLAYILLVFYLSEPKYSNDVSQGDPQVYDYVIVPSYSSSTWDHVDQGIVLQRGIGPDGKDRILIKITSDSWSKDKDVEVKGRDYRIVGKGTIYHKINRYIGFNIMMITQVIVTILLIVLAIKVFQLA